MSRLVFPLESQDSPSPSRVAIVGAQIGIARPQRLQRGLVKGFALGWMRVDGHCGSSSRAPISVAWRAEGAVAAMLAKTIETSADGMDLGLYAA